MSVVVPRMAISKVAGSKDPKQTIFDEVGNLAGVRVNGDRVLVATYIRSEMTGPKKLILRPDSNVEEDVWQGKVAVILKMGPHAFKDTVDYTFDPEEIAEVGDWVSLSVGDGKSRLINGYPCRMVRDVHIEMIIDDPDIVF